MAPLLSDGAAEDAPDPADVELLDPASDAVGPDARAPSRSRRVSVRRVALLVGLLGVGVATGAGADSWVRDRQARMERDLATRVEIADVSLRLSSFQLSAVDVALRNEGPRNLVLEQLSGEGGAVRPLPGVLPLSLPPGHVVVVRLRFGDRCPGVDQEAARLDAVVRTSAGAVRTLALDVVGDAPEVQYVASTVHAACG